VLKALGANAEAGFAQLMYGVTGPLVAPFRGLFDTPQAASGAVLEMHTLIALVIYAMVAWLLMRAAWLAFGEGRSASVARTDSVLWQVIAAMEAGTVLGSSLLYLLARRGGRGVVERYGPFIGIGPKQLERAERQLQRHGAIAVVLGRLLPGLRVLTAIGCGIFRVPYRVFLPAMSLGSLVYIVGYTMLGYFAGPAVLGLFEALHLPIGLVGSGGPLLLLLTGLILVRRGLPHPLPRPALRTWQRARVGLLAARLATLGALFTLDLMVLIAGDMACRCCVSL